MKAPKLEDVLFVDIEIDQRTAYGAIICICVGKLCNDSKSFLNLRCFYNENEAMLLLEFNAFLSFLSNKTRLYQFDNGKLNLDFLLSRLELYGIKTNCKKVSFDINKASSNIEINTTKYSNTELDIEDIISNSYLEIINTVQLLLSVKKLSILATENIYYV